MGINAVMLYNANIEYLNCDGEERRFLKSSALLCKLIGVIWNGESRATTGFQVQRFNVLTLRAQFELLCAYNYESPDNILRDLGLCKVGMRAIHGHGSRNQHLGSFLFIWALYDCYIYDQRSTDLGARCLATVIRRVCNFENFMNWYIPIGRCIFNSSMTFNFHPLICEVTRIFCAI